MAPTQDNGLKSNGNGAKSNGNGLNGNGLNGKNGFGKKGEDGFTAGLQFWLFFLLTLVLLGFPLPYAIVFGAMGGMAGGFAVGWWQDMGLKNGFKNSDFMVILDAQRLLELDQPEAETYERAEQVLRRRTRYVSNRPYDRETRKQAVNTWLSWRRGSRPRAGRRGDR